MKFLYQLDVDDPLLYDLVLNTERLTVEKGAAPIRETLRGTGASSPLSPAAGRSWT